MNIRVSVEPDSDAWRGQISLEDNGLTAEEQKSLVAYSTFVIDAGSAFDGADLSDAALVDISFSLTENLVALPDNFPVIEVFTGEDADKKAAVWVQIVQARITEALVAWLALSETWERNTVHTIP